MAYGTLEVKKKPLESFTAESLIQVESMSGEKVLTHGEGGGGVGGIRP